MRFMVLIKGDKNSEAGVMPDQKILAAMGNFNEELVKAGVMKGGEGLHPSKNGARVRLSKGGKATVIDGPFTEAKELVAGFWIWEVKSRQEAIDWVKRMGKLMADVPVMPGSEESEIEIRQIFEAEEFGAEFTPELRAQEERLRAEMAGKK